MFLFPLKNFARKGVNNAMNPTPTSLQCSDLDCVAVGTEAVGNLRGEGSDTDIIPCVGPQIAEGK